MSYGQRIFSIVPDSTATPRVEAARVKPIGPAPEVPLQDQHQRILKDLRISVIDQCNFRCTYCMPKEVFDKNYTFLSKDSLLSFDEIERLARTFVRLGVEKLRITGGEPLLRKNIEELIARLSSIHMPDGRPVEVAMTTNGALLAQKAQALKSAGLRRITVSLDALSDKTFRAMNDVDFPVTDVLSGIDAAANAGLSVKVNMVVQRGVNDHEILPMADAFRQRGHTLRFIEFMDVGSSNAWQWDHVVPSREIIDTISLVHPLLPIGRDTPSEVSERWRYADGRGQVGVISSVSNPFCGNCSRARISAEGVLYTCLFAHAGTDLRGLLRGQQTPSDSELIQVVADIWQNRTDRYSEQRAELRKQGIRKVEMSYIGG
ncbi:MAG: GTP 3',8-cyclase MoaA [Burkholderiaceae bacterium]|nr:GTP 3',8-cyclase MoaA [Burkholderiaceae bacterium]